MASESEAIEDNPARAEMFDPDIPTPAPGPGRAAGAVRGTGRGAVERSA